MPKWFVIDPMIVRVCYVDKAGYACVIYKGRQLFMPNRGSLEAPRLAHIAFVRVNDAKNYTSRTNRIGKTRLFNSNLMFA